VVKSLRLIQLAAVLGVLVVLSVGQRPEAQAGEPFPASNYGLTEVIAAGPNVDRPVDLVMIPGSNDQAVVVMQSDETVYLVSLSNAFPPQLYGDLKAYVEGTGVEQGLLSLAFSPNFGVDQRVYVYYTQDSAAGEPTVLSRFQVVAAQMVTAGPGAETRILEVPDNYATHNGGKIIFGDDGYLYLSIGDGGRPVGGKGDIDEHAQNIDDLRGKILRLNVTGQATYSIPGDNPFVGAAGADEIWAYGFRNPWRMSEDRLTKEIWLGDAGEANWEEVDKVVKGGNFGWDCYGGGCPV
jgi:glucose/arabinose dehydrogenase